MIFIEIVGVIICIMLAIDRLESEHKERKRWSDRREGRERAWLAIEELKYM